MYHAEKTQHSSVQRLAKQAHTHTYTPLVTSKVIKEGAKNRMG